LLSTGLALKNGFGFLKLLCKIVIISERLGGFKKGSLHVVSFKFKVWGAVPEICTALLHTVYYYFR